MKNIHVLPTDKSSRLSDCHDNKLYLDDVRYLRSYQNIYITSDSDLDINDWVTDGKDIWQVSYILADNIQQSKKIILTIDQDLIKDGVQAIDDDFLEWFVKNPSCEWVEVEEINNKWHKENGNVVSVSVYKIIIPKEEPKQERMYNEEEIFEKDLYNDKVEISVLALIEIKRAFGALIKDENSYLHKVFMDDNVIDALRELKSTYAKYFDEQIKDW